MKIIFYDLAQLSDAPAALLTAPLDDRWVGTSATIDISSPSAGVITGFGIGGTDATEVTINGETVLLDAEERDGLYELVSAIDSASPVVFSHNGTYVGRLALGTVRALYGAPMHDQGFYTTQQNRVTATGAVVPGAGGYSGRRISLDFRYKFTETIYRDIEAAFPDQLARALPLFLWFDRESRMPFTRMYAGINNDLLFQSSVNRFLYSQRLEFMERF